MSVLKVPYRTTFSKINHSGFYHWQNQQKPQQQRTKGNTQLRCFPIQSLSASVPILIMGLEVASEYDNLIGKLK